MQLDIRRVGRINACGQSLELFGQPMCLSFEKCNARDNEMLLARILNGTRLVKV